MPRAWPLWAGLVALVALPPFGIPPYLLHIADQILLWSFIYTAWSLMGRFGLTSFGHGGFLAIGAYTSSLLWNYFGLSPWVGIPAGAVLAAVGAVVIGYPCFRLKVVGHYFALVTLAFGEVIRLAIIAARDITGGSLGMTPNPVPTPSLSALQFADKETFYYIALGLWLVGLVVWRQVDRSMEAKALTAISDDEDAAAAVGINVARRKLAITLLSAVMTAIGGSVMAQYLMYLNPETMAGINPGLQIVFAAIAGGMYSMLGPTAGAVLTIVLAESLRILFGSNFIGAANTIYGILLILFIIFLPRGLVGALEGRVRAPTPKPEAQRAPAAGE
jgi:branched-chain amino acid transport system permease protein